MSLARMADAAFAQNIPPGFDIAGGYIPGRADFHAWPVADWGLFPGYKLPITVPADPGNGPLDAQRAAEYLRDILRVPHGCIMALDMEGRIDAEYVTNFGAQMLDEGYKTWVYGERSTLFGNPPLNGYWVADFGITRAEIEGLLAHPHCRAVQWATGPYDQSDVKPWVEGEMWHG